MPDNRVENLSHLLLFFTSVSPAAIVGGKDDVIVVSPYPILPKPTFLIKKICGEPEIWNPRTFPAHHQDKHY
jgi:hypothetical protein